MYIPALAESDTSTEQVAKEPREKKEKPKSKSAQQVNATFLFLFVFDEGLMPLHQL